MTWDVPHERVFLSLFSVAALVLLSLGLTALWVPGIAWCLAVFAFEYWARLSLEPAGTATWAPLLGAALLVLGEASYLSLEFRGESRTRLRGRLFTVAFLAIAGAGTGEALLLGAALLPIRSFGLVIAGALAVAVLLGGLVLLAGRSRSPSRRGQEP